MICISEYTPLSKYVKSHEDSFKDVVSDIFKPKEIVRIEVDCERDDLVLVTCVNTWPTTDDDGKEVECDLEDTLELCGSTLGFSASNDDFALTPDERIEWFRWCLVNCGHWRIR